MLNVVDGCIPSDLGAGTTAELEEERRLLYVGMTRARDSLSLITPQRFFTYGQNTQGTGTYMRPEPASSPKLAAAVRDHKLAKALSRKSGAQQGIGQNGCWSENAQDVALTRPTREDANAAPL